MEDRRLPDNLSSWSESVVHGAQKRPIFIGAVNGFDEFRAVGSSKHRSPVPKYRISHFLGACWGGITSMSRKIELEKPRYNLVKWGQTAFGGPEIPNLPLSQTGFGRCRSYFGLKSG